MAYTTASIDPSFHKWPASVDDDYVTARRALLEKEYALVNQIEEVAAQRRALPAGPVLPTYTFEEGPKDLNENSPVKQITLAEVAKPGELGHKTLVVYHMMVSSRLFFHSSQNLSYDVSADGRK